MKNFKQTLVILFISIFLIGTLASCMGEISPGEREKRNKIFIDTVAKRIKKDPNANLNDLSLEGVTSLEGLFEGKNFTGDISKWDVSKIENFGAMFKDSTFNGDISRWNVSKGKNFKSMFENSGFNGNIIFWRPTAAKNIESMFKNNTAFDQDLSSWPLNNNIRFNEVFDGATNMLANLKKIPEMLRDRVPSRLKPIDNTVESLKALLDKEIKKYGNTADYNYIDTSDTISFEGLFKNNKEFNGNISKWNVSKVTNFKSMFEGSTFNGNISDWKPEAAKNMQFMFKNNTAFDQDLSSWIIDESKTLFASIFKGATKMLGTMDVARNSPAGTDKMPSTIKARYDKMIKPKDKTIQELKKAIGMVVIQSKLPVDKALLSDFNGIDTSENTTFEGLFNAFKEFNGKINDWDTSSVTTMKEMFEDATAFNTDIGDWDTSNVINMDGMFAFAKSFNKPLGKWNLSKVESMHGMFYEAAAFDQDLTSWNDTLINPKFLKWLETANNIQIFDYAPIPDYKKPAKLRYI